MFGYCICVCLFVCVGCVCADAGCGGAAESVKEQNRLNLSKAQSGNSAAPKVRGVDGNGQLVKREATPSPNMRSPMPPPEDDDHGLVLMDEEDDVVAIV